MSRQEAHVHRQAEPVRAVRQTGVGGHRVEHQQIADLVVGPAPGRIGDRAFGDADAFVEILEDVGRIEATLVRARPHREAADRIADVHQRDPAGDEVDPAIVDAVLMPRGEGRRFPGGWRRRRGAMDDDRHPGRRFAQEGADHAIERRIAYEAAPNVVANRPRQHAVHALAPVPAGLGFPTVDDAEILEPREVLIAHSGDRRMIDDVAEEQRPVRSPSLPQLLRIGEQRRGLGSSSI